MERKPTQVDASSLALPREAFKYVHAYRKTSKLLDISATQLDFKQHETISAYEHEGQYFMFRNFLWFFVYPVEAFDSKPIEVDLFDKPRNVQAEIDDYMLHSLHLMPSPSEAPKLYVDLMKDLLPRLCSHPKNAKKRLKYSRRSLARISNISENVVRANMMIEHEGRINE